MERSKDSTGRKKRYCGKIVDVSDNVVGRFTPAAHRSRDPVA